MFEEEGKEQGGEEEEGTKRQRTAVEEVEKHIRKENEMESSKSVGTDVREQPGASLQSEDSRKDDHGSAKDLGAAPEFDEQGCVGVEVRKHKIGTRVHAPHSQQKQKLQPITPFV